MGEGGFEAAAQAIEWMNGLRYKGEKQGLRNMLALLEALGHPEEGLRFVHVAGTNGKGSVCAMTERMLRENGYATGLYTSPYLMRFQERIRVGGVPIGDDDLIRVANRVRGRAEALLERGIRPTTFELITAAAMCHFKESGVEIAVLEVGMGGRLDPTNFVRPEVCLIAPIDLDHTRLLGDTLAKIAYEKAGIIKERTPVAASRQAAEAMGVIEGVCAERRAPLLRVDKRELEILREDRFGGEFRFGGVRAGVGLAGGHQAENAALALAGIELLAGRGWRIDESRALRGLREARWPGRLEWIDAGLLIDGAHNPHGARALRDYAERHLRGERIVIAFGMMRDKPIGEIAGILAGIASDAVVTRVDVHRAQSVEALAETFRGAGFRVYAEPSPLLAVGRARELAGPGGIAVACGSLYLAGEVRLALKDDGGIL